MVGNTSAATAPVGATSATPTSRAVLAARLRVAHYRSETPIPVDDWHEIIHEHAALTAALRARDPQAARDAATNHVRARTKADTQ